jgi:hypothetical protein
VSVREAVSSEVPGFDGGCRRARVAEMVSGGVGKTKEKRAAE